MVVLINSDILKFGARLFLDQLRTGLSDLLLNLRLLGFDSNQVECAQAV